MTGADDDDTHGRPFLLKGVVEATCSLLRPKAAMGETLDPLGDQMMLALCTTPLEESF